MKPYQRLKKIKKMNRIKEDKNLLLHHHQWEIFSMHTRKKIKRDHTPHEDMLEEFNDNSTHQEKKKIKLKNNFFKMTRNEHLTNYKDS